tara:strand:- start:6537 stop:6857 length:321 start_codon:yes stop_codon:yes gene_type:complete
MNKISVELVSTMIYHLNQMMVGPVQYKGVGICGNLSSLMPIRSEDVAYDVVKHFAEQWPLSTGHRNYPVWNPDSKPLWEGEQLVLRLSLMKFIIVGLVALYEEQKV